MSDSHQNVKTELKNTNDKHLCVYIHKTTDSYTKQTFGIKITYLTARPKQQQQLQLEIKVNPMSIESNIDEGKDN